MGAPSRCKMQTKPLNAAASLGKGWCFGVRKGDCLRRHTESRVHRTSPAKAHASRGSLYIEKQVSNRCPGWNCILLSHSVCINELFFCKDWQAFPQAIRQIHLLLRRS